MGWLAGGAVVSLFAALLIAAPITTQRVKAWRRRRKVRAAADDLMDLANSLDRPYGLDTCEGIWAATLRTEAQGA